jgi:enterochelin esterase-like enzyme
MATSSAIKTQLVSSSTDAFADTDEKIETQTPITGQFVTETLDYDGGRQVTVYVPPVTPKAIVFAGDGQLLSQWGSVLEASTVPLPPTMIVGIHRPDNEMLRLHEYSPIFDVERFAAHEKFLIKDVHEWVRLHFGIALPPERTAVLGVSASGELALAMGALHPDIFGVVLCASPGAGYRPPVTATLTSLPSRAYLVAGTQEPFFLENATRWAVALRENGVDVVMAERVGRHGDVFWKEEFPLMIKWAFEV